jgi:hypothetical protein
MGRGSGENAAAGAPAVSRMGRGLRVAVTALQRDWADQGFRTPDQITREEYDFADASLHRINTRDRDGKIVRPYTNLFSYKPHMERNKAHWIDITLRYEHADGHLYGIAEIEAPVSFIGPRVAAVKVEDYGTDLQAAIIAVQQLADDTFSHFWKTSAGSKASFAEYPKGRIPASYLDGTSVQMMNQIDKPFVRFYDDIVRRLSEGVAEAANQRQKVEAEQHAAEERMARIRDLGYV